MGALRAPMRGRSPSRCADGAGRGAGGDPLDVARDRGHFGSAPPPNPSKLNRKHGHSTHFCEGTAITPQPAGRRLAMAARSAGT